MPTQILPSEARQARAFLFNNGIASNQIPPRQFAMTAKTMNKSFAELLRFISVLKMQGQGQGQSPEISELIREQAAASAPS